MLSVHTPQGMQMIRAKDINEKYSSSEKNENKLK